MLDLLTQAPRTVADLARASGQSSANASQHLKALHVGELVTRERQGRCALRESRVRNHLRLLLTLREASAHRLAEVERAARAYLGPDVEAIDRQELVERLARGDAGVVDVRSVDEYKAGHIEGARSIPLEELKLRLAELPAYREVVAHCRGPYCAFAHQAVRELQAAGHRARRLADGWPEWRLAEARRR
jgi:rhodanese-related sulfurtransferase